MTNPLLLFTGLKSRSSGVEWVRFILSSKLSQRGQPHTIHIPIISSAAATSTKYPAPTPSSTPRVACQAFVLFCVRPYSAR